MRARSLLPLLCLLVRCTSAPPPRPADTAPPQPTADLVLLGGIVETLDPATSGATAIAIKDGKIARVGSDADIKRWIGAPTKVVELKGRAAVPGLVDSHM